MATKKKSASQKPKQSKTKKNAPPRLMPAVPPPDNPLMRFNEFDADREFHSKEMAEKRLEAIEQTRQMPTGEEDPSADSSDQQGSPQQSHSEDDG